MVLKIVTVLVRVLDDVLVIGAPGSSVVPAPSEIGNFKTPVGREEENHS